MTKAQLDLAYKTTAELSMYANAAQQYGHSGMADAMRTAADLLTRMVEEAEVAEPTTMGGIDRKPSPLWKGEPIEMSNLDDEGRS